MAMIVDWEYFFPDVYFKHNRFETWSKEDLKCVVDKDGNWDPQKDFEFHLDKLKVESNFQKIVSQCVRMINSVDNILFIFYLKCIYDKN